MPEAAPVTTAVFVGQSLTGPPSPGRCRSQNRADLPRGDLLGAEAQLLGFAELARGHADDLFEQLRPPLEPIAARRRSPGVEIDVPPHALVELSRAADLEARDRARTVD